MDQISPPMRIVLGLALLFVVIWFVALRGGGEGENADAPITAAPPAGNLAQGTPAVSAPGQVKETVQNAANEAEQAGNASNEVTQTEDQVGNAPAGEAAADPANPGAPAETSEAAEKTQQQAKPDKDSGLPLSLLRAIARRKVLLLLFYNPSADDDRAVRREFRHASTHGGKVYRRVINIRDISRYAAISRGVNLNQAPTLVVVDRRLGATPYVGYLERVTINQAINDALRIKP